MNDRSSSVLAFLSRMRGSPDFDGAKQVFDGGETAAEHEAAVEAAQAVTPTENAWLQSAIARDERRDECEEALIRFLDEEGGSAPV
jgi:hypothetical protein